MARAREPVAPWLDLGLLSASTGEGLAADPYPYGIAANRRMLEAAVQYSHEQGLTPRRLDLAAVFAAACLET